MNGSASYLQYQLAYLFFLQFRQEGDNAYPDALEVYQAYFESQRTWWNGLAISPREKIVRLCI